MPRTAIVIAALVAVTAACGSAGAKPGPVARGTSSAAVPRPTLPRAREFVRTVSNPWFPLRAGTVLTSKGRSDGTPATDVLRVTHRTKRILGIRATVIDDRVYMNGHLEERTTDWYAQDKHGNVWYLGEKTATLTPGGRIESTDGSWLAGRDGARPGIFMPANPRPGLAGQQEIYKGHAEDRFEILNLDTHIRTPAAASRHAMLVRETTPLEPGVIDHKVYVRGIGTVSEETVKGGNEQFQLVSIHRP